MSDPTEFDEEQPDNEFETIDIDDDTSIVSDNTSIDSDESTLSDQDSFRDAEVSSNHETPIENNTNSLFDNLNVNIDHTNPLPPSFTIRGNPLLTFLNPSYQEGSRSRIPILSTTTSLDSVDTIFTNLLNLTLRRIDDEMIVEQVMSNSMETYYDELFRKDNTIKIDLKQFVIPLENESGECNICLDKLVSDQDNTNVIRLKCRHTYHETCIVEYLLRRNRVCPICRSDLLYVFENENDRPPGCTELFSHIKELP